MLQLAVIAIVIVTSRLAVLAVVVVVVHRGTVARIVIGQRLYCLSEPRVVRDSTTKQHRRSGKSLQRQRQQKKCCCESEKSPLHFNSIAQISSCRLAHRAPRRPSRRRHVLDTTPSV